MTEKPSLSDFFSLLSEAKSSDNKVEDQESKITGVEKYLITSTPKIEDINEELFQLEVEKKDLSEVSLGLFGGNANTKYDDPLTPLNRTYVTFDDLQQHYKTFVTRVQQQLSTIGGGGETHFLQLDDVKEYTASDNKILEYDAASGKVQFTTDLGPIESIRFDISHVDDHVDPGTLCWNSADQTLNIHHPAGVVQQIGQETYAYVRNGTESTIFNGTAVQFIGAEQNGTSRLLVGPMLADGTYPSLYVLGIATQDIEPGEDGRITVWGKVRDLDTSVWNVGDLLYISPDSAGKVTNIKPTAPNNVIPIAAVLATDSAEGEIFVRPTIEQDMHYGRFTRLTNQTVLNSNEANPIQFDTVEISNGINFNGGDDTQIIVASSGFYQFDLSAQITATSNKGVVYFWFRKNGVDIPHSTRSNTVTNGDTFNVSTTIALSLDVNDYIQVMWARSADGILLDAKAATAFAPSTAAVMLNVTQIQL